MPNVNHAPEWIKAVSVTVNMGDGQTLNTETGDPAEYSFEDEVAVQSLANQLAEQLSKQIWLNRNIKAGATKTSMLPITNNWKQDNSVWEASVTKPFGGQPKALVPISVTLKIERTAS